MAPATKIVFLGASSASFGMSMFRDLFSSRDLAGSTLVLVGRNVDRLDRSTRLARLLNEKSGAGLAIEMTTDWRAALDGAEFVVHSTAIDRNRLWRLDFEIPRKFGIRHTLGENGGPGGLFFTLRTLPVVFDFVREMERRCPRATFINFSNPESRIILALKRYSGIRSLGLCHGIFLARDNVARILGMPGERIDVWGAGLNHFQCLTEIRDRETGEDLYPLLREKERDFDPSFSPLTRKLLHAFGYWLGCGDAHVGEYLSFGWEAGEGGYNFDWDESERVKLTRLIDDVLANRAEVPDWWLKPSGERAINIITSIFHNRKQLIESAVVHNRQLIPNLPADAAVEVPVMADVAGIHPVSLGPLPDGVAKLMTVQVQVQQMAVEAAMHASKDMALQALLLDPVIHSERAARGLLDELWAINRPYIRACI
ncbi:alpha-glucosidase/alpha-galactosidase [Bradyrhizobium sp. GCM10027634]|uniref:family 4 glycosyl hydrolase n=1 Tax=unclassified Bradyrhizobium TaxID=2631580 RepID=UPI00188AB0E4|nr:MULTISPECIES: alpha-glucosidase/alpha-galactosidase [unclassified Bradyrhizobium]MDN5002276.1 alpha-glucosidase/alpha-galactosidase [Bradyrhizobium sp. WYCCWR 12677]QOZ44332.1 alpha-glucosidase/alpha-galactosidase [Bradyrhizobium sp. CCBAU 53340]